MNKIVTIAILSSVYLFYDSSQWEHMSQLTAVSFLLSNCSNIDLEAFIIPYNSFIFPFAHSLMHRQKHNRRPLKQFGVHFSSSDPINSCGWKKLEDQITNPALVCNSPELTKGSRWQVGRKHLSDLNSVKLNCTKLYSNQFFSAYQ